MVAARHNCFEDDERTMFILCYFSEINSYVTFLQRAQGGVEPLGR